jgi:hypothetical protein
MITFNKLGRYGRLGNQMFQIASTIGIARKNGYDVGFPEWKNWDAKERFGSDEDIDMMKYFPKFKEYVGGEWRMHNGVHQIPFGFHGFDIPDNVSIEGHMQSEKYFKHCEQEIRELFTQNVYENNKISCIHMRLGDFSDQFGYHPLQTLDYYEKAIYQIGADKRYFLYSDDPEKACKLIHYWFNGRFDIWVMPKNDCMDDFNQMQSHANFICANSTFSWWAAWLATNPNKKVVMPSNWFGPAWTIPMPTEDIYFENVIVI